MRESCTPKPSQGVLTSSTEQLPLVVAISTFLSLLAMAKVRMARASCGDRGQEGSEGTCRAECPPGLTCSCRAVGSSRIVPSGCSAQVTPQKRVVRGSPASSSAMQAAFRQQDSSCGGVSRDPTAPTAPSPPASKDLHSFTHPIKERIQSQHHSAPAAPGRWQCGGAAPPGPRPRMSGAAAAPGCAPAHLHNKECVTAPPGTPSGI